MLVSAVCLGILLPLLCRLGLPKFSPPLLPPLPGGLSSALLIHPPAPSWDAAAVLAWPRILALAVAIHAVKATLKAALFSLRPRSSWALYCSGGSKHTFRYTLVGGGL